MPYILREGNIVLLGLSLPDALLGLGGAVEFMVPLPPSSEEPQGDILMARSWQGTQHPHFVSGADVKSKEKSKILALFHTMSSSV